MSIFTFELFSLTALWSSSMQSGMRFELFLVPCAEASPNYLESNSNRPAELFTKAKVIQLTDKCTQPMGMVGLVVASPSVD